MELRVFLVGTSVCLGVLCAATSACLAAEESDVLLASGDSLRLDMTGAYAQPEAGKPENGSAASEKPATGGASGGATGAESDAELSKKLSNPVADLISIPFQLNYDKGIGPNDTDQWKLNIQPVIPVGISEDWNLIIRTILPVIWQGSPAPGVDSTYGLGDTVQSFFFSPKEKVGGWILGAGPVFNWPTLTDSALGNRNWGVGPTAVALRQEGGLTYGILANQIWSFAGPSDESPINATFLQPFISYTFPTATSVTLNTESTYDWTQHQWTVPINLIAGQIIRIGKLPVQLQLGGRYYADKPDGGPDWGLRFALTILLPK